MRLYLNESVLDCGLKKHLDSPKQWAVFSEAIQLMKAELLN